MFAVMGVREAVPMRATSAAAGVDGLLAAQAPAACLALLVLPR